MNNSSMFCFAAFSFSPGRVDYGMHNGFFLLFSKETAIIDDVVVYMNVFD